MNKNPDIAFLVLTMLFALPISGAASASNHGDRLQLVSAVRETVHRDNDDLLTAGLGEKGLRNPLPPVFANPEKPESDESRRRAVWNNWRGIADLSPGGGFGEFYGSLKAVPGREYQALAILPGARQPHRVMLQLPDSFDRKKACVVVTASSGSRGIYGAIALAGGWGLPRACAIAYTDKGAGTDYVGTADATRNQAFDIPKYSGTGVAPIAIKHANSGDNPEADWGRHVHQAADFALQVLNTSYPDSTKFTYANTQIIAVGVSNGGGAVLRAAESKDKWADAVVAISPNIWSSESGGRAIYDYATEAALWMPCALNATAFDKEFFARPGGAKSPAGTIRCASLKTLGWLKTDTAIEQAEEALAYLHQQGWSDAALSAAALSTSFDLWRSVIVTYASSYAKTGADQMPCGFAFHALGTDGKPRVPTSSEKSAWTSDASGIPPGAGVFLVDTLAQGSDPALPGLLCLRELKEGKKTLALATKNGIDATRAGLPRKGLPVLVIHGINDGLIPEAFGSAPYVAWAKKNRRDISHWRVDNAQHFDGFLGLPVLGARYVPLMPYAYRGLDAMWEHIAEKKSLPMDADIVTTPRKFEDGVLAPLRKENLGEIPSQK
ncbi:MAG: 3-hydroxybutyrate oligomer hydrolase family protein [Arenimonas sp.]